jgi:hypothetical protein
MISYIIIENDNYQSNNIGVTNKMNERPTTQKRTKIQLFINRMNPFTDTITVQRMSILTKKILSYSKVPALTPVGGGADSKF